MWTTGIKFMPRVAMIRIVNENTITNCIPPDESRFMKIISWILLPNAKIESGDEIMT